MPDLVTCARSTMTRITREPVTLTASLISGCHPAPVADEPGVMRDLPEHEIRASLGEFVRAQSCHDGIWVFAYGSLLWNPEVAPSETRLATVRGWHRRFCLWQWRHRGSRERPGLMLALDTGGACRGVVHRVDGPDVEDKLLPVWHRELRGDGYRPRVVIATTEAGAVPAVAFVVNRAGPRYAGRLPEARVARHIASACGAKGPSAEYLRRLVLTLEGLGIRDRRVWRLQRAVSQCLAAPGRAGRTDLSC